MADLILLRQADPKWSSTRLGTGSSTIGRGGCLLCALTMAANHLHGWVGYTPLHANEACIKAGAFTGSLLFSSQAAVALEMVPGERFRGKVGDGLEVAKRVDAALRVGRLAIVHVDHDSDKIGGDFDGEHFVLALRRVEGAENAPAHFECADPALGAIVWLDAVRCEGTARWGKNNVKQYKAVGCVPLGRK